MSRSVSVSSILSRRTLLGSGAATALSAATYRNVLGANDRVGLGFIGFGLIGKRHVLDFRDQAGRPNHGNRRGPRRPARRGRRARRRLRPRLRRLPRAARRPRRRRRGRLDARPLARLDDDDGLRGGQGRVCRKAADPVSPARGGGWSTSPDGTSGSSRSAPSSDRVRTTRRRASWSASGQIGQVVCGSDVVTTATSCLASARLPTASRRLDSITTCGSAPPRSGRTTRTGRSTTSDGSGIIRAGR